MVRTFHAILLVFTAALLAGTTALASAKWDPWKETAKPAADRYSAVILDDQLSAETNPVKLLGLYAIRLYQVFMSPRLASNCQFHPSCSRYTFSAIRDKGFINGTYLGAERLLRCNGRAHLQGYPEWNGTGLMEDPAEEKEAPLPWISRLGF